MQLQTILNRVEKYKPFVYGKARFVAEAKRLTLLVEVHERKHGRPVCSGCRRKRPGDDRLPQREYQFLPLRGLLVFFLDAPRRVDCPNCGVKVEHVPWRQGKRRTTTACRGFLAAWARRLSGSEVAEVFGASWQTVFRSVRYAVMWGIVNDHWQGITAIGIDEIAWRKGHKHLRLVYQIGAGRRRLLFIARERTKAALEQFFDLLTAEQLQQWKSVVSGMWQNCLDVAAERAGQSVHVLDRFHIMKKLNEALDQIRRGEARRLKEGGCEPVLKHSRRRLLKRPENRTAKQTVKMSELLQSSLKSVRGYLHREEFQRFWEARPSRRPMREEPGWGRGSPTPPAGRGSSWTNARPA